MNKCNFCDRVINNKGSLVSHTKCCIKNPNRTCRNVYADNKGCIPWNKNKTFKEQSLIKLINTIENNEYQNYSDYSIRRLTRLYLIHKNGHRCMMCGLSEWMNMPIPLVSDHIDGDTNNNELNNFRIICNNCDATLPTFKGKNRGNGRKDRYKKTEDAS